MKQVIILKGLPASGKSTWAKEQVKNNPGAYKRVNKDALRAMLDESRWSKENEKMVLELRDSIILSALKHGKHVIVDDTNLAPKHEADIRQLVKGLGVQVRVKFFDVPLDECIARDAQRADSVGEKVIREMHERYLVNRDGYTLVPIAPVREPNLRSAIIVDLDGTLAIKGERSPYEWDKVGDDTLNLEISRLVDLYAAHAGLVIIVSGRDSSCRKETLEWLERNKVWYNELFMRPERNMEKDSVIKRRIYEENIRGKYNIDFVLDDRNQVVDMWRSIGLTCLQVAPGDF